MLSPRTGAQGAVLRSARAESADRRVKQVLLSFWQIASRQDWPAMGPFLALLALLSAELAPYGFWFAELAQ